MNFVAVMSELEALGNARMKKIYLGNGAHEPLFGVATGAMKPMVKKIKINQPLAEELYATGNYDAMYLAGMIADPKAMTVADFDRWMETAYFPMLSDFVVAVTLAEADCAEKVAGQWIDSGKELYMSAGWSCYEWLLGWRPDSFFDRAGIAGLLDKAAGRINDQSPHLTRVINNFIAAVGISYLPLHEEALRVAAVIGGTAAEGKSACDFTAALTAIQKAKEKGKIGFKRRAVRC